MSWQHRGQTSIDFAIAMGIFLVAFTTVVAFLPEITQPFTTSPAETPLVADRLAAQLADHQLAASGRTGALNTTCTLYFFNTTASANPCPSFDSDQDLNTKLGVDDGVFVNVTVERNVSGTAEPEVLCAKEDPSLAGGSVVDPPCSAGDEFQLAVGESPPSNVASVSVARRAVLLDGRQDVLVFVRVWT